MRIYEYGLENPEYILLIHPSLVTWDYFENVIPLLEKRYHLLIPALPGYDLKDASQFSSVERIASALADPASIQRDLAAKTGLCDPSEIRRVCKQTGGQRAMEKHMAICGQSEGTQKRDQHAADELPGRGLCKEARV